MKFLEKIEIETLDIISKKINFISYTRNRSLKIRMQEIKNGKNSYNPMVIFYIKVWYYLNENSFYELEKFLRKIF